MNKQIKDHKPKIDLLEENIKKPWTEYKKWRKSIKNLSLESQNELILLNDKFNSLLEKKVESLGSNIHGLDIMNMFRNDSSRNIYTTRLITK